MSYTGRVYRVLIASPSDVEEEREIAVKVMHEWNDLHSHSRQVVLLPLRWETHTAPEYGARPQEVINRAIVDNCDLLIGVFWARIGTPTGKAESGTLEEIDRVGKAGKPIMLYFSKVGIDPDQLDLAQVERLKAFKTATYPNALTESYKSMIDFRDKFARQLEIKVRDLQAAEDRGGPPLAFGFLSLDTGEIQSPTLSAEVQIPVVGWGDISEEQREQLAKDEKIQLTLKARSQEALTIPVVMAIKNLSSSGVRDLFVDVTITTSKKEIAVVDTANPLLEGTGIWKIFSHGKKSRVSRDIDEKLSHLEPDSETITKEGNAWRIAFEWNALQPQRIRYIKPKVYIVCPTSGTVTFSAKAFADSFPKPIVLEAKLNVNAIEQKMSVKQFFPDLLVLLADKDKKADEAIDANFKMVDDGKPKKKDGPTKP